MNKDIIWVKLMKIGARLECHQLGSRSFFYKGYQFPLCARCTGIHLGIMIGFFIKIPYVYIPIMLGLMIIDGTIQLFTKYLSNNRRRFITGVMFGIAVANSILLLVKWLMERFY